MKLKFEIVGAEKDIRTVQDMQRFCKKKRKACVFHNGHVVGVIERTGEIDYKRL